MANLSIFKTEMNKRWLYVHKGGGPLQLLRIILATGGIVGTGVPSSSLVLGEPQEKAPGSANMRRKGGKGRAKRGKMMCQAKEGRVSPNCAKPCPQS